MPLLGPQALWARMEAASASTVLQLPLKCETGDTKVCPAWDVEQGKRGRPPNLSGWTCQASMGSDLRPARRQEKYDDARDTEW